MTPKPKKILLWNPISNHGHLNMYLEIYASTLLDLGYEVYYYADFEEAFKEYLNVEVPMLKSVEVISHKLLLKHWTAKWIYLIMGNLLKRVWTFITCIWKKALITVNFRYKSKNSFVEFGVLTRKLKVLNEFGFRPDLVICMYLDMTYLDCNSRRIFRNLSVPWVGLLFHPQPLPGIGAFEKKSWFSDESNMGGIFFTNNMINSYNQASSQTQVFEHFPDVTRESMKIKPLLDLDLRKLSNGRNIVGLVGALDGNKKLIQEFLDASKDPRLEDYYFVIAGEVYEATLEKATLSEIRSLSDSFQQNLYIYDKYIESEVDFDYLISQVDILFACYKNFDSSANILAKSARFRKPVIVRAGTWIGQITEQYNLGLAISNPDVSNVVSAILNLGQKIKNVSNDFGFDSYMARVSTNSLKNSLKIFLEKLWERKNSK